MYISKKINKCYEEFYKIYNQGIVTSQNFGKWEYFYHQDKDIISLVKLKNTVNDTWYWEICDLNYNLIKNCEHFKSQKDAVIRIKKLFGVLKNE
jgi:hypothetical protein